MAGIIDHDEYGKPVRDDYKRLGAGALDKKDTGLYVRFETGFGTNVHIGHRRTFDRYKPPVDDPMEFVMGIQGWERLCELVDEWRARKAAI